MKLLIAFGKDTYPNPYVRTLADGISKQGIEVVCSIRDFWENWRQYDIIHIQWPQELVKNLDSVDMLSSHLNKIKQAGIPIITTCHNFKPHYSSDELEDKSYAVVYELTDCFIHLGSFSYDEFLKVYPDKQHVIIPHHLYDEEFGCIPARDIAIRQLRLDKSKRYILCFGAFRSQEEREIANIVSLGMADDGYVVLAPGFHRLRSANNFWKSLKYIIRHVVYRIKYHRIRFSSKFVPDEELPYYYAASDIALIQRLKILNSGNLPMAFMMGKVVVGPDVGNVGTLLKETGNPTFDVNNLSTLVNATKKAVLLVKENKGKDNQEYAYKYFATSIVARQHIQLYQKMLSFSPDKLSATGQER